MKTTAILAALAVATEARFEEVGNYETFTPAIVSGAVKASAIYPEDITMTVPFEGKQLVLDLHVDTELFAEDWKWTHLNDDGSEAFVSTDASPFMCHYTGTVVGDRSSVVTVSACHDGGVHGVISTEGVDVEIQSVEDKLDGQSIVYNLKDLILPEGLEYGHLIAPEGNATDINDSGRRLQSNRNLVNNMVTASDRNRMNAFSSTNAEVSNTQSVVSQMNSRYTSSSWQNGNTLRIQLQEQVTNANMGTPTSNLSNYLGQVAAWKASNRASSDNVQGFTSYSSGGVIGVAYVNTMCQSRNSAGINNVGFTNSDATRGILVAHECGHNFNMGHDNNSGATVMSSSINSNARSFSSTSVGQFNQRRGNYGCL